MPGQCDRPERIIALGYNSQGVIRTTATSSSQFDLDGNLTQSIDADGRVIGEIQRGRESLLLTRFGTDVRFRGSHGVYDLPAEDTRTTG